MTDPITGLYVLACGVVLVAFLIFLAAQHRARDGDPAVTVSISAVDRASPSLRRAAELVGAARQRGEFRLAPDLAFDRRVRATRQIEAQTRVFVRESRP